MLLRTSALARLPVISCLQTVLGGTLRLHGLGRLDCSQLSSADRCGVLRFHSEATPVGLTRPNYPKT